MSVGTHLELADLTSRRDLADVVTLGVLVVHEGLGKPEIPVRSPRDVLRAATRRGTLNCLSIPIGAACAAESVATSTMASSTTTANISANRRTADGRWYVRILPPGVGFVCFFAVMRVPPSPLWRAITTQLLCPAYGGIYASGASCGGALRQERNRGW